MTKWRNINPRCEMILGLDQMIFVDTGNSLVLGYIKMGKHNETNKFKHKTLHINNFVYKKFCIRF